MSAEQPPRETAQDVFRLLLDTYRDARLEQIDRMWPGVAKDRARDQINANVVGWLTRYDAAAKREGRL